jgi:hypothetical protein
LRSDCDQLMTSLMAQVEESLIDVQDDIYLDYKRLKADIREQRHQQQKLKKVQEQLSRATEA